MSATEEITTTLPDLVALTQIGRDDDGIATVTERLGNRDDREQAYTAAALGREHPHDAEGELHRFRSFDRDENSLRHHFSICGGDQPVGCHRVVWDPRRCSAASVPSRAYRGADDSYDVA